MKLNLSINQWKKIGEKMGWLKIAADGEISLEEPERSDAIFPEFSKIKELMAKLKSRNMGEEEKKNTEKRIRMYMIEIKIKKLENDKKEARHSGGSIQEVLKKTKSIEDQISKMIIEIVNLKGEIKGG
jgi:hypothetical protein